MMRQRLLALKQTKPKNGTFLSSLCALLFRIVVSVKLSLGLFRELMQGVEHRLAGNPDQPTKGLI